MKILLAVLKFALEIVFAAFSGGASNSGDEKGEVCSPKPSDMVVDKNGDMKFKTERVEYY